MFSERTGASRECSSDGRKRERENERRVERENERMVERENERMVERENERFDGGEARAMSVIKRGRCAM